MAIDLAQEFGFTDSGRTYRLGIMGGTFDPIHIGHLVLAEEVMDENALDGVVFIPTGNPVFKLDKPVSDAQVRLEMCRLATQDNPGFAVSDIEVNRTGATYTIDTLDQLKSELPSNVELFFIMASDVSPTLPKWKDAGKLGTYAHFILAQRPGSMLSDEQRRSIEQALPELDFIYTDVALLDVSSTGIRRRTAQGRSTRYLVPDAVHRFIGQAGLYKDWKD